MDILQIKRIFEFISLIIKIIKNGFPLKLTHSLLSQYRISNDLGSAGKTVNLLLHNNKSFNFLNLVRDGK
jgi:hypothetical protein